MSYSRVSTELARQNLDNEIKPKSAAIEIKKFNDQTIIIANSPAEHDVHIQIQDSKETIEVAITKSKLDEIESDFVFIDMPESIEDPQIKIEEIDSKFHDKLDLARFIREDYEPAPDTDAERQPLLASNHASLPISLKHRYSMSYILKGSAKIISALLFSATNAIFSLVMLSGKPPEQIGKEWWNDMSTTKKVLSIILALSAELVNAEVNADFLSEVLQRLQSNLSKCTQSVKHFLNNIISLFFGGGGGIAAGALAYEAFSWLPGIVYVFSAFNTLVYLASRYLGVNKFIDRMLDRDTTTLQRDVVDHLKHLKPQFAEHLNNALANKIQVLLAKHAADLDFGEDGMPHLNASDFEILFETLGLTLAEIANQYPDCFNEKTNGEYAVEYAGAIFDISFSAMMALMAFMTFTTKAQLGVQLLLKLITGTDMSHLPKSTKATIGSVGGTPSGCLYGVSAQDFRQLLVDTCEYLYHHPQDLPTFFLRLTANIAAATGMYGVGYSLPGPDNLFGIGANPVISLASGVGNGLAVFVVNMGATLKKYSEQASTVNPSCEQVAHHFQNPALRIIKKPTANSLRQHALFKPKNKSQSREERPANRPDSTFVLA